MKTVRILIFGLLAMATASRAQITNGGWYYMPQRDDLSAFSEPDNSTETPQSGSPPAAGTPILPLISQPTQYIAEAITPQIQTLANDLQDNPVAIYNYVHDHIKYVPYWGSKKGAQLTLLEKSGNDFDQSALLAALLQAAGYNPTYQFGWMQVPYDAKDGTHNDLHHWLQLNFANTNWNYTSNYLFNLFYNVRGYPTIDYLSRYTPFTDTNTFMFQRVWVTLTINSTNYFLDPAFKVSKQITNAFNLASAMQFSSNSVMSTAGGTETGGYSISGLNEANIRGTLTGYTTNLLNYIQSNSPNASMQQVLGGWQIVASTNTSLPTNLAFAIQSYPLYPAMNVTNWSVMPTNFMVMGSFGFSLYFPDFGMRLRNAGINV